MAMSEAFSIQSFLTTWPRMSSPRMSRALLLGVVRVLGQLHAAGLAAAAGQHLRLDDDLAADLLRRPPRLFRRRRDAPVGDGDAEALEQLLALVLVQVHRGRSLLTPAKAAFQCPLTEKCCRSLTEPVQ